MNTLEIFLSDLGFSFTLARMLPYLAMVGIGGVLAGLILKYSKMNGWKLWTVVLLVLVHPFTIYFALFPIYQGDLMDLSYTQSSKVIFPESKTLIVVALPGCQYCVESTQQMKYIRKHTDIQMAYWVISNDQSDLKFFSNRVGRGVLCQFATDIPGVMRLTQGSFPTYLLVENGKLIKAWHNDTFGVRAIADLD
jgi:hypothetical protein